MASPVHSLELDLDVFAGPFDLLLSLILREDIDLLEVELADIVVSYLDHLESREELDLESATEFLVLIAALLELKSRLMLPGEELPELDELAPAEAAEELLARMLQYARFRGAGAFLGERRADEQGFLYRSAPLPEALRRAPLEHAGSLRARGAGRGAGRAAAHPAADRPLAHGGAARRAVGPAGAAARAAAARALQLRRGGPQRRPPDRRGDDLRAARALQARRGRVGAGRAVRRDHVTSPAPAAAAEARVVTGLARLIEALLFLAPDPVPVDELADALQAPEEDVVEALGELRHGLGGRGVVLRELAGGWALASHPDAEEAARRLLARPRTPSLTPAQAETLSIVAYLQPVSRPEVARIRGVASESAAAALTDRGLIEESGRSQFGAVLYRTTPLFLKLFGLKSIEDLPDPSAWDPSPEDEAALRDRLLRAGEERTQRHSGGLTGGQLAAGGVDVAAAGEADGGVHAVLLERGLEGGDRLARGAVVGRRSG